MKVCGVKIVNNSQTMLFQTILEVPTQRPRQGENAREFIAWTKQVKIALVLTVSWSVPLQWRLSASFVPIATSAHLFLLQDGKLVVMNSRIGSQSVVPTEADIDAVMLEFVHMHYHLTEALCFRYDRTRCCVSLTRLTSEHAGWQHLLDEFVQCLRVLRQCKRSTSAARRRISARKTVAVRHLRSHC